MDRRALDHALERRRRHRLGAVDIGDERRQIVLDEFLEALAQFLEIDGTGAHHARGVRLVDQGHEEMFERREFVAAGVRQRQGGMDGLLESRGE